jgi:uncharacterized membrane protein
MQNTDNFEDSFLKSLSLKQQNELDLKMRIMHKTRPPDIGRFMNPVLKKQRKITFEKDDIEINNMYK